MLQTSTALLKGTTAASPSFVIVEKRSSSQFRKAALALLGMPRSTTWLTGMNGRSSIEAARMPYSWAKRRAVWKVGAETLGEVGILWKDKVSEEVSES